MTARPACLICRLGPVIRADAAVTQQYGFDAGAWQQPWCWFKFKFRLSTRMSCPSNCLLVIWLVGLRVAASARRPDQPEAWTRILRPFGRNWHRNGRGFIGSLQFVQFRYKIVESAISFEISHLAWQQPGCLFKFKFRLSTRMSCPSNGHGTGTSNLASRTLSSCVG